MAEGRAEWPVEPNGWYVEPISATTFLLDREKVRGPVWDPCCGMGNVVKACLDAGVEAWGTDLVERGCVRGYPWWNAVVDFLAWPAPVPLGHTRTIVMNPPYGRAKLAEAFIRHALTLDVEMVCAFVNAKFIWGEKRASGLYRDHPPARVYPISPRPSCPPGQYLLDGGKAEGGVENFAWIVWRAGRVGTDTQIIW